eukprot:488872_1
MSVKRLQKEFRDMETMPPFNSAIQRPDSIKFDGNPLTMNALIIGPSDTPYHNGHFYLTIQVPPDYPFKPPRFRFVTKIMHCQINDNGAFYFPLQNEWSPRFTLAKAMESILAMLEEPDADEALIPRIAKLYKTNRKQHDKLAYECTIKHAIGPICMAFSITERTFKYDAKQQQIVCNFTVKHRTEGITRSNKNTDSIRIIALSKQHNLNIDGAQFATVKPNVTQYSFCINKQIQYGSIVNMVSYIELKYNAASLKKIEKQSHWNITSIPKLFVFDKTDTEMCIDMLPQHQYLMLINAYLAGSHDIVPLDVIKLCFKYYYLYSIRFIFQSFDIEGLNNPQLVEDIKKEYRTADMILTKARDIQEYDTVSNRYASFIWKTFNLADTYRGSSQYMMKFDDSIWDYPKVIRAQLRVARPATFVAKYNDESETIIIADKGDYKIHSVKQCIKNKFNIPFCKGIKIDIKNGLAVNTDLDFLKYLVGDHWSNNPTCVVTLL